MFLVIHFLTFLFIFFANNNNVAIIYYFFDPVSYTHLDVYKRQTVVGNTL